MRSNFVSQIPRVHYLHVQQEASHLTMTEYTELSCPSPPSQGVSVGLHGQVTETSYLLPQSLTYEAWAHDVAVLQGIPESSIWWLADALNFGEQAYGEKYTQAVDITGLSVGHLANIAWVGRRFAPERRIPPHRLSFSHHQEVGGLEVEEQDEWLRLAEEHGWTTAELRRQRNPNHGNPPAPKRVEWALAELQSEVQPLLQSLVDTLSRYPMKQEERVEWALPWGTLEIRLLPTGQSSG